MKGPGRVQGYSVQVPDPAAAGAGASTAGPLQFPDRGPEGGAQSCSVLNCCVQVEIRSDVMVPYHATKAWGQVCSPSRLSHHSTTVLCRCRVRTSLSGSRCPSAGSTSSGTRSSTCPCPRSGPLLVLSVVTVYCAGAGRPLHRKHQPGHQDGLSQVLAQAGRQGQGDREVTPILRSA